VLPVAELSVGVALVSSTAAWWGAVAALVLLTSFTATMAVAMAHGRMPVCRCFGSLGGRSGPLAALTRNEMLAALAALVVWQGRHDANVGVVEWLRAAEQTRIVAVVVLLAGVLLVAARVDSHASTRRIPLAPRAGIQVGEIAPHFHSYPTSGGQLSLRALLGEQRPLLLIFSDQRSATSVALLPMVARWKRDHGDRFQPVVIEDEPSDDDGAASNAAAIMDAYHVRAVPSAVFVRADGRIASALAVGLDGIEALARRGEAVA
jgi:hypothetical protein